MCVIGMPVRRCADSNSVQHVWDAVRCTLQQRQQSDMARLTKYLQRVCELTAAQAEQCVRQALADGMLVSVKKTVQKGTKMGLVTESFRIPTTLNNPQPVDDGHDWYCTECHLAGDVICCRTCSRVFHMECMSNGRGAKQSNRAGRSRNGDTVVGSTVGSEPSTEPSMDAEADVSSSGKDEAAMDSDATNAAAEDQTVCSVCRMLRDEKPSIIEREELNYLLNFTLNRIRIWLPSNVTDTIAPRTSQSWMTAAEVEWRARQLIYRTMDIPQMETKLRAREYTRLAEFHADVLTIQHNVAVFHGLGSQEMQGSELMLTDCRYDLTELRQCVDCYRHSNEKRSEFWFCVPCRPSHDLVWAKQKGYPYWPAKVIRAIDDQYDVRFFGAKHLRALVDRANIKPIETNVQSLQVKRTQAFNKAMTELAEHQRLLREPDEVAKLLASPPRIEIKKVTGARLGKQQYRAKRARENSDDVYEFHDSPSEAAATVTGSDKTGANAKIKKRPPVPQTLADKKIYLRAKEPNKSVEGRRDESADSRHDHVSSSTENIGVRPIRNGSASGSHLDRAYSEPVERLRRQLEQVTDRDAMVRLALELMQHELDRCQDAHSEHLRSMVDAHNVLISEIKKKQWCYNCEQEAIYHCCWNTAYCSTSCQQQHWQSEHKKVCRRKR